jgi:uncharacterized membrane protein (DUF2068 family)|tara:strand:- start:32 stop:256 length:225 start_codon:yes stop_codon:yes gene_type:complete
MIPTRKEVAAVAVALVALGVMDFMIQLDQTLLDGEDKEEKVRHLLLHMDQLTQGFMLVVAVAEVHMVVQQVAIR